MDSTRGKTSALTSSLVPVSRASHAARSSRACSRRSSARVWSRWLVPRRPRILEQERMRHEDHPGRAEAALDRAALHERPLQRVQRAVRRGHALDREHAVADYVLHALDADLQRRIVDQDGARAARADVARVLRAGQVEVLAEELDEPPLAGGIGDLEVAPVDVELHSRHSSSGGSSGSADILIGSANSRRPVAWKMALAIA